MSKNKDKKNYELKSEAIDKLLKAEAGDVPEFSEEELKKYRSKGRIKISDTAKVLLLKAWFAGAVCYFILWGLGMYLYSLIDMLFILGIIGATPLMRNTANRLYESKKTGSIAAVLEFVMVVLLLLVCTGYLVDGSFSPFLYFRF